MKIEWSDVINVLIALAIFKVIDKMFLDTALDKMVDKIKGGE